MTSPTPTMRFKQSVTPSSYALEGIEKYFFTISVGSHKQSVEDIAAAYLWARSRYNIKQILIGDSLYKITLRICENLTQFEAEKMALQKADKLIDDFRRITQEGNPIDVRKTSEILCSHNFDKTYSDIENFYESDVTFNNAIDLDAKFYVARQKARNNIKINEDEALTLSILYLKQEVAVYLWLAERGWLADLYLGNEIPTLAKIMEGAIPAAPDALKRRVNIGLRKLRAQNKIVQKNGRLWRLIVKRIWKLF